MEKIGLIIWSVRFFFVSLQRKTIKTIDNMEGITVQKLASLLMQEIAKGNGKKKVMLSNDDEGNGYHEMFFGVTDIDGDMASTLESMPYMLPHGVNAENISDYVILG